MRSPFSSRGFTHNRAPEYRTGLKVPANRQGDSGDGLGRYPLDLDAVPAAGAPFLLTILSLFLDFPNTGSGARARHRLRGAPALLCPWCGPRDLGMALGACEGRVRSVGGARNGPAAGGWNGLGYGADRLRTADDNVTKPLLQKVVHTM